MLTIEEIARRMSDRKINAVADAIGMTRQAVANVVKGRTKPSYDMLVKLSAYLENGK